MQPADDKESYQAKKSLMNNVEYKVDLTKHGTIIQYICFGTCTCTNIEKKFHWFTSKSIFLLDM